jgi:BirA family biotin operon repressor/biotin-[acetyl-CoA-carboxylase] ligase
MTALTAVVCRRAIERVLGVSVEIKWVNDLYLSGKKVAGILAESFECDGRRLVAVGIGINISTHEFPDDIRATADSLKRGGRISGARRAVLAEAVTQGLLEAFSAEDVSDYMRDYRAYSCVIGREVEYTCGNERGRGTAIDITDAGALIVSTDSGTVTLRGGEISLRVRDR